MTAPGIGSPLCSSITTTVNCVARGLVSSLYSQEMGKNRRRPKRGARTHARAIIKFRMPVVVPREGVFSFPFREVSRPDPHGRLLPPQYGIARDAAPPVPQLLVPEVACGRVGIGQA